MKLRQIKQFYILGLLFFPSLGHSLEGGEFLSRTDTLRHSLVMVTDKFSDTSCSGVLIDRDKVLTAGHCLAENSLEETPIIIRGMEIKGRILAFHTRAVKQLNANDVIDSSIRDCLRLNNGECIFSDIGILYLEKAFPEPYRALKVFTGELEETFKAKKLTIAGFGQSLSRPSDPKQAKVYRHARMTYFLHEERHDEAAALTCDPNGESHILPGDSGGPVLGLINGEYVVISINSTGEESWGRPRFHGCTDPNGIEKINFGASLSSKATKSFLESTLDDSRRLD